MTIKPEVVNLIANPLQVDYPRYYEIFLNAYNIFWLMFAIKQRCLFLKFVWIKLEKQKKKFNITYHYIHLWNYNVFHYIYTQTDTDNQKTDIGSWYYIDFLYTLMDILFH